MGLRSALGLTLLEMIVVLAVLSILTGISLAYFSAEGHKLKSEAQNVRSFLMEAKMRAIQEYSNVSVTFDATSYTDGQTVISLPSGMKFTTKDKDDLDSETITYTPTGTVEETPHIPHIRLKNLEEDYYSVCVNSIGRIWIFQSNAEEPSCSN